MDGRVAVFGDSRELLVIEGSMIDQIIPNLDPLPIIVGPLALHKYPSLGFNIELVILTSKQIFTTFPREFLSMILDLGTYPPSTSIGYY